MDVARRREGAGPPVAVPGEDHRQLGLEVDLRLEQQRPAVLAAQRADRGRDLGTLADPCLAPSVVAAERQLEPARVAERVRGGLGVVDPAHLAPRRRVLADLADEPPLREPVLGRPERRQPGPQRGVLPGGRGGIEAHVLQLVRDDVAPLAQPPRGVDIVIAAHDQLVRDGRGRAGRVRVERDDPVAHRPRRDREHPAELAAAHDPDRGAGWQRDGAVRRRAADPGPVQRVEDEVGLARRVQLVQPAVGRLVDDPPLGLGVRLAQRGVRAQRLAERDELGELPAGRRHDVEVDPVRLARRGLDRAGEHRPGRRERGDAALAAEAERQERVGDRRDVVRVRLDAEVEDVLARQPRHRRAADVLDDRPRARPRRRAARRRGRPRAPPGPTGGTPPAAARTGGSGDRTSRRSVGRVIDGSAGPGRLRSASPAPYDRDPHRRSAMRIVTGRRVTEVDVG